MFYLILLVFFLIQFLVILGVLIFAIFFARPKVPLSGDGTQERPPDREQRSFRPPEDGPRIVEFSSLAARQVRAPWF